jgi:hypothetical protein
MPVPHLLLNNIDFYGKRNLPLEIVKLETMEQAQAAPTPATIFTLFYEGKFVTTDISACMDSRFDKAIIGK